MILSLILGVVLGALSVIFVLQNVAVVTVSFFAWQLTASLALILFATLLCGVIITLLVLLPGLIRDEIFFASQKRRTKELEDQLAAEKAAQAAPPAPTEPQL